MIALWRAVQCIIGVSVSGTWQSYDGAILAFPGAVIKSFCGNLWVFGLTSVEFGRLIWRADRGSIRAHAVSGGQACKGCLGPVPSSQAAGSVLVQPADAGA